MSAADSNQNARAMTLIAAFLGWMFDGLEMGIFPLVARPALQEFQATAGIVDESFVQMWMGYITAAFLLGAAAGGLVFGWLGDRIGRVRAMVLSVLAYSLFTGLNYFAEAPWQLALFRFIAALGMGGEWSLGVALVMEAWPQDKRPLMAGLIGAASNAGYVLIAVLGLFVQITTDSWRWVMLVGAAPALLALFIMQKVPESASWKQAVVQGRRSSPLREIFSSTLRKNTLLAILFASVALTVTWGIVQWIPLWADQLTHGQQPKAKAWIQICSCAGSILSCIVAPLIGAKFGRRPVYFALCLGSLVACSLFFRMFDGYGAGFLAMTAVVGAWTGAFYGWLPQYLPELFPTRVRATGQGLAYNSGRIIAAIGAWQMGSVMSFFGGSYPKAGAAIVVVYLIGMIAIWFAPETKDRPLPE
ncbi:MAG: MFS transporter [Verrucomicrobiales bacterium]|nr:MFS transporter [Verrucomicrobiales bacterium]